MTTATSILRTEHESILRVLDATEEIARQLNGSTSVAPETLAGIMEFLRLFADRMHHGKEEDLLFPLLETKGIPRNGGPVGVMLQEHDMGRALIRQMGEASDGFATGTPNAGQNWAQAALQYVSLLRLHIQKENNILFAMAEQILSSAEQAKLVQQFDSIETQRLGTGTRERLLGFADKLSASVLS